MRSVLPPIVHKDSYSAAIEKEIVGYFHEAIFGPLLDLVREFGVEPDAADQGKQNAIPTPLEHALKNGRIWYADGVFSGEMSAATSRELRELGATWNREERTFRLPLEKMPITLRSAVALSQERAVDLTNQVSEILKVMPVTIAAAPTGLDFARSIDRIAADLHLQFDKSVSGLEEIEVPVEITPEIRKVITEEFTENLDLYIKSFAEEEIPILRRMVEQNAFAGYRPDRLAEIIEARYGVSKRKANFLASQETSLLVSKYRQQRYQSLGSRAYKWSTSNDQRVRHDHRLLNGKVFFWDQPPVTNLQTGARNNPGEDYNCRCVPLPIIETEVGSILP